MTTTTTLRESHHEYGADALIMCDNLVRIYQVENIEVQALQGLDLLVNKGEMIAIVGQSGSGKSTLLNVLSGLDVPTAGAARVAGWDLLRMSHADRLTYRRSVVGFVWQQTARNLLPYLTAKENVMLPMAFRGTRGGRRSKRALELLAAMGMADKAGRRPGQLSGGEQQRVAIAVALANEPEVLYADEPTGELDSATGDDVFAALRSANQELGATVVVVTHDHAVSSQVQRTVAIRDGRTATEVVKRTHIDHLGQTQTTHEEYAVLDRAGRLQLPSDYRSALGLKDRVRLELEPDHLGVWPDGVPRKAPVARTAPQPQPAQPQPAQPPAAPTASTPPSMPAQPSPAQPSPATPPAPATPQPPASSQPPAADPSSAPYLPPQTFDTGDPYVPRQFSPPTQEPSPGEQAPPEQLSPYAAPTQPQSAPLMPWLPKEEQDD